MAIFEIQSASHQVINVFPDGELLNIFRERLPASLVVLAKIGKEVDILAQMQDAFNNFMKSGQAWALGIGVVLGYMIRSFTAY